MEAATKYILDAKVTLFDGPAAALWIYAGSTLWFLALLAYDVVHVAIHDPNHLLHSLLLASNVLMFLLQSWNALRLLFTLWPVVSLYYAFQLWAIALRAALVARAADVGGLWAASLVLFAQCLFTSSQLAVTLEHLYRVAYRVQDRPAPPTRALAARALASRV